MGVFIRNLVEKDDFPAEDEQKDSEMLSTRAIVNLRIFASILSTKFKVRIVPLERVD
jgi:hypothetical protein